METKINKHNLFKFLKRDLREAGLNQDDWLSYLQLLDAPDLLNGIYLVSQQILKISKLMTAPIVSEDSIEIVSILSRCSAIVDSNQMLLRKEFGDCVLKKPTTAKSNPLYYLLFHGCKPEMRKEYYKLLMWMFIAFNKRKENNTLSKNSNYHYGLAARSISDEHSIGNILEEFDTSITYTSDVITELRRISESSHLVRLEPKTKISLSKIITLLSPGLRGKNKEIEHSKHNRSYFLPTPRRGYIPNIARIINRNLIKLKIRSWSPKEILSGDIQDSQLNNYAPAGEPADEVKTGLMSTEIREHEHRPELHKYKLIAIANAIAKGNQTIPNQLSLASSSDISKYSQLITNSKLTFDTKAVLSLNLLTGIPIQLLAGIKLLIDGIPQKGQISFDEKEGELILPIQQVTRKRVKCLRLPTHFPLIVLSRINEWIAESLRSLNSRDKSKIFRSASYYQGQQKSIIEILSQKQGTELSVSKIDEAFSEIGLSFGIDPVILSQICQREIENCHTQQHYTAVQVSLIQQSYTKILNQFTSTHKMGEKK